MSKKAIFTFGTVVVAVAILAVAIPLFFPARVITTSYPCVNNLRIIEESKEQWALDKYKTTNDVPSWDDLRPYFPNGWTNGRPVCPEGGLIRWDESVCRQRVRSVGLDIHCHNNAS